MLQHSFKRIIVQLPTCFILCLTFLAPSLAQAQSQKAPTEVTNQLGMILKRVPKGEFLMGSPSKEIDYTFQHAKDERQHRVLISYDFYMGQVVRLG